MKWLPGVDIERGWLEEFSWKSLAMRFVLGGIITVLTGLIAKQFGPTVGGLFLTFPAILPASVTLIEKDDGQRAAGASALGASIGAVGMLGFGLVVWLLASRLAAWQVLIAASGTWLLVSTTAWLVFERLRHARKALERDVRSASIGQTYS